ncbi:hypothetical protein COT27_01525 [Candidatus Kuenenbacteria bacterium CG08_land_8_20_14_0_20_37_23]|uniref:Uncharacterized protein n=1 Tax=Candidatus Kuenenbacteria bacterium CG08_land_8_20_14_0_20_37_23 TaxID=1974617 RepID=A0A2M6XSX3_9BACT|nr:MAG: hypothetical protein COT27_01525 [Candidatus Kuenenbacteria bacterium CG08_land_8_20_14_0_20_37_23]
MKKYIFLFVLLFIIAGLATGCGKKAIDKINFDLYVMSQCPYGSQAEDLVYSVIGDFKEYINFNVEYIAADKGDGSFESLHGASEVEGDIYQLCVKKQDPDKFWDYIKCQNKNYQDLKLSFESCAKENGIDYGILKTCADGEDGKRLLSDSIKKSEAVSAAGSPTFYIDGERYAGPRTEINLQRKICEKTDNTPKKCKDLSQDKEFTAHLIIDSRCTKPECETVALKDQLKNTFSKIIFAELDYATDDGKKFFTDNGLQFLPAVLFEEEVKEADNFSQVEKYLTEVNGLYSLNIGAIHNPVMEICDNNIDDTDNGLADCADADCESFTGCRAEIKGRLDVFVMSQCPYGTQALDAMREVMKNFGNSMDFHVNYIANENTDGTFASLHGQGEVDENIRELCAARYYPTSYMDYIWCRNKDITGDYKICSADFPKITACSTGTEGAGLLKENIKLANTIGIGASPTWMVNNRYQFNGIDAETIKTNFCQYNNVAGCESVLSSQTNVPAGSCN